MKQICSVLILLLSIGLKAQMSQQNEKPTFSSINSIGFVSGSTGDNFIVQTINGIKYKKWNVGIGTGIDWYGVRSVPLVLDARRNFTHHRHQPFIYANGGFSFTWANGSLAPSYYSTKIDYKNTYCYETGAGYNIAFKNKTALVLSVGYSYKLASFDQYYNVIYDIGSGNVNLKNTYDYNYRRIAVRVGLQF